LINGQGTTTKRKVPFLGDLPGIGKAFRYDHVEDEDRELLIFVTPHIVRGVTSLGEKSATARGEDVAVRRMLDQFMDKEMDSIGGAYENFEKTKRNFFSQEEELVRDSERRFSNPVVEKQMTQALDALSPQMVDRRIGATLDSLSLKK
jgi:Flp pilus assembly secretin CpaC